MGRPVKTSEGDFNKLTRHVSGDRVFPTITVNHLHSSPALPFLLHLTGNTTMSRPSPSRQPSVRPPTAVTGPFFPAGDTATFKDLLSFEER
jgi:hypothetical protein